MWRQEHPEALATKPEFKPQHLEGQAQVVPVHTDETHVVSTMLLGEKVWQVCTAGAGSAGDPCTGMIGS